MRELRLPLLLGSVVLLLAAGGCANRPPVLNCVADQTHVDRRRVNNDTI